MRPKMGFFWFVAGLLVAAAPAATAAVAGPATYYRASGFGDENYLALGWALDGAGAVHAKQCLDATINEWNDEGQVHSLTYLREDLRLDVWFENATQAAAGRNYTRDLTINGDTGLGETMWPRVKAMLAASGTASVLLNAEPLKNPVTGEDDWGATFFLTTHGMRDDEEQSIQTADGSKVFDPARPRDARIATYDPEAHLVVHNPAGVPRGHPAVARIEPGFESMAANPAVDARHFFANTVLQGTAQMNVVVHSDVPGRVGTSLTFEFLSPTGRSLARETIGAGGLADESRDVSFVLDEFGTYEVHVTGSGVAASYAISGLFERPTSVAITQWWEDFVEGPRAGRAASDCMRSLGDSAVTPDSVVGQSRPPGIDLRIVALGIVASVVTVLIVAKLVAQSVHTGEFRRQVRHR